MDCRDVPEATSDGCGSCALVARRDFLARRRRRGRGRTGRARRVAEPASGGAAGIRLAVGGTREEKSYAIPAADGTQIDKDESKTIITRWQNKVYVFSLACPHQNTALRWYEKDHQFECPKHHSRFEADGIYIKDSGRATRRHGSFAVRKDGNNVVVNLDKLYQEDEDEAAWKAAFVNLSA